MKRIATFVFLCAFILTMTAGAWADNEVTVISKDVSEYDTLENAIKRIEQKSGDVTIKLKKDVTSLSNVVVISIDNKLTIDLNGHSITATNRAFEINSADVTITGKGTITGGGDSVIRLGIGDNTNTTNVGYSTLKVDKDVTIESNSGSGIIIDGKTNKLKDNKYGQILDFNGTIRINAQKNAICNLSNKDDTEKDSTDITIGTDAVIEVNYSGGKAAGIFHPGSGDLKIKGGTIKAPTAIEVKRGNVTISGGQFTSSLTTTATPEATKRNKLGVINIKSDSTTGNITSGYSFATIQSNDLHSAANITITGGQFKGYIAIIDTNEQQTAVESNLKVTGGSFSSSDVKYYVPEGTKVTQNGEWWVVGTASSSTPATKTVSADVSSSGALTYQVENGTATLAEVADKLDSAQKAKVTSIELDSKITAASNSDLKSFSNLKTLALKSDSAVSDIDLSGVSATTFNAKGATKLSKLTLKGNSNIATVDISGTAVSELDASDCKNLKTVDAENGSLEKVTLNSTTQLTELKVPGNKLEALDLSSQTSLTSSKTSFGGQKSSKTFTRTRKFNFAAFMNLLMSRIAGVYEISSSNELVQDGNYDKEDGEVAFDDALESSSSLRYFYNTGVTFTDASTKNADASLVSYSTDKANAAYMDVTLASSMAGTDTEDEATTNNSSSGGCNAFGSGILVLAFAAMFMDNKKGFWKNI